MKKILLTLIFSLIFITSTSYAFAQHIEDPVVVIETNQGEMVIEFFHLDAPKHTENFILLSNSGYYDGVLYCHGAFIMLPRYIIFLSLRHI